MSLNPEFVEWVDDLTRGVRVLSLRKLVLFFYLAKNRFENIDWQEWKSRNPERRQSSKYAFVSYVGERDMIEVKYYAEILKCSPRLIFDYWQTLRLLVLDLTW